MLLQARRLHARSPQHAAGGTPFQRCLQDAARRESPPPQAELFWPDDGKWYLIEIQGIDPALRKAK